MGYAMNSPPKKRKMSRKRKATITGEAVGPGILKPNLLNPHKNLTPEQRRMQVIEDCARGLAKIFKKKVEAEDKTNNMP